MIVGRLSEVPAERNVLPAAVVRGIEALVKLSPATANAGRYEVEGEQLFVLIQDVDSRTFEESRPEAHAKFADVQIPLSASERYGFSFPQPGLACTEDRLEANDVAFTRNRRASSSWIFIPAIMWSSFRGNCTARVSQSTRR